MEFAARVAVAVEVGGGGLVDFAEGDLDQAVDDRPLVREVEVQRRAADERAARDGVDRDALVGLLGEGLAGGVEDQGLGVVAGGVGRRGDRESLRGRRSTSRGAGARRWFAERRYAAAIARQAF